MPFTAWGTREILAAGGLFILLSVILHIVARATGLYAIQWLILPLLIVLCWVLWFFRDPHRTVPREVGVIVSPADGTVTHLDTADEPDYIGSYANRCSIFLSIFDVHLNRAPTAGTVEFVKHRPGAFFDARLEESLTKNENQDIGLKTTEPGMPEKMLVRQSTGAIARRIVCPVTAGQALDRGECYGMIKFGSRTTLFMSTDSEIEWCVSVGDKVKAGETVLAKIKNNAQ